MNYSQTIAALIFSATVLLFGGEAAHAQKTISDFGKFPVQPSTRLSFQNPEVFVRSNFGTKSVKNHGLIQGELGERYEILIRNPNPQRAVALISVDGLSIFSGRPATWSDSGYIIEPFQTILVKGWRKGDEHSAVFSILTSQKQLCLATRPSQRHWHHFSSSHQGSSGKTLFQNAIP